MEINMMKDGKWSEKLDECKRCHRNDRPCQGRGLCQSCYSNWAYHNLPGRKEYIAMKTREWQKAHPKRTVEISKKAVRAWRERFRKRDPEGLRKFDRENWRKQNLKRKICKSENSISK